MKKLLFLSLLLLSYNYSNAQNNPSDFTQEEIDSLVNISYKKAQFKNAIKYSKIGQKKVLETVTKEDSLYASYTAAIGFFHHRLDEYAIAEQYYKEALNIQQNLFGKYHSNVASSINNLANLYRQTNKYNEAERLLLESKKIREKLWGKKHPKYAIILNNLASLYKATGAYEKALPLLIQSLTLRENFHGKNSEAYVYSLNNLADFYQTIGKDDLVEKIYLDVLDIWKKIGKEKEYVYSTSLNNLGSFYHKKKQYKKAILYLNQANKITAQTIGKNNIKYAATLSNKANLYIDIKEYSKAEQLYLEANKILLSILTPKHPIIAHAYNDIATLYMETKDYKKAIYYSEKAIKSNVLELLDSINFTRLHHCNFAKPNTLLISLKHLLIIEKNQYLENPTNENLIRRHCIAEAALAIQKKSRYNLDSKQDKLRILKNTVFLEELVYTASVLPNPKYKKTSFNAVETNKSALLLELFQSKYAQQKAKLPDSIIYQKKQLEKQLLVAKKEVYLSANTPRYEEKLKKMSNIQFTINDLSLHIQQAYPKYYNQKYQNIAISIEEVQSLLNTQTILIEYFVGNEAVYIYSITKNDFELIRIPFIQQQLFKQVKELHQALSNYQKILSNKNSIDKRYSQVAYSLYKAILAPVLKDKQEKELLIIPDNYLGHLPFEAFLTKSPHIDLSYNQLPYLIDDYCIGYNYSATLWKENRMSITKKNNGKTIGFSASYPIIDSSLLNFRTKQEYNTRITLQPLPAALKEVQNLSKITSGQFYFGTDATEALFKEKAPNYNIIHLATHGILNEEYPMLSSLALTENLDSTQNNFLQAYEIASMELNANLIVLSACETGFGKFEQGEGIMSLARSFMYAGTPSLVVSLWSVNDQSTSIIMQDFYKNLIANMPKNEALRQAKLNYIQRATGVAAHPAFWSPFIQLGNEEAIVIQTKSSSIYWFIGIGSILILFLGITFFLKRKNN